MKTFETHGEGETIRAGRELAAVLGPGDVVACVGGLGSGKTRFIKGVCEEAGVASHVSSPTFTILNEYRGARWPMYHFDLYRVASPEELRDIGFEEYLEAGGVCLIEWADRAERLLPPERYEVSFRLAPDPETRIITITHPAVRPA